MNKNQLPQLHLGEPAHYTGKHPANYRRTARPELLPAFTPFSRQDAAAMIAALDLPRSRVSVPEATQLIPPTPDLTSS